MTVLLLVLGAVVFVAVLRVWWHEAGTEIAAETHDAELMEESWNGATVWLLVAVVVFVLMLALLAGGAL